MHLVIINQYFPPDAAPTGLMLDAVAQCLVERGHEVTVICSSGGYALKTGDVVAGKPAKSRCADQRLADVRVNCVRLWATHFGRSRWIGKLVDYASFYLGVAWMLATMSKKPDRIVAMTTPPYLSVMARFFSKLRGANHAHWVMDLYPDAMVAHGMLSQGSLGFGILSRIARWGFGGDRCAGILFLGPDMVHRAKKYLTDNQKPSWVPLWSSVTDAIPDKAQVKELRDRRGWDDSDLVFMYSGNMGLGHLFDEILEVAQHQLEQNKNPGKQQSPVTRFVFYGAGKRRKDIEDAMVSIASPLLELHDYVAPDELQVHLASADVHLVSLRPEWDGVMVPSKLQGIFAARRPVIFIGSEHCSIGKWILESGGGWVVDPGDIDALRKCIDESTCPEERSRRGKAAYAYALKRFDRIVNASDSAEVLSCEIT